MSGTAKKCGHGMYIDKLGIIKPFVIMKLILNDNKHR